MPTFPHLPSPNMITSAPSALSLPLLLPPQSGASTSGSSMHAVLQTTLQIQPNPILPQQPILPHFVGDDEPVVCVICGGICKITDDFDDDHIYNRTPHWMRPILVQAKPEYLEWQKQRPSTRRSYCNNVELIEQTQVTAFLGGSQGMKLESETLYINTTDLLMRIPIHLSCFKIADIFCKDQTRYRIGFRDASGGAPSSIPQLYEIWCKRAIASHPGGLMSKPILEANMYFGAPAPSCSNMADYDKAMVKDPSLRRFLAYPLTISGLTDIVVNSNLQTMDGKERRPCNELAQLLDRIQDMPQEIFDQITGALEPFEENRGPPLQPTRVLPPNWWKRRLLSGKLIPWLWDLDENDVFRYRAKNFYEHNHNDAVQDQKRGEYIFDENMWDWELLCRQLAQFNVMERGGLLEGESKQLWNRRRIWKLLDAARLGHIPLP
ncbi:hypothetical protein F4801DRAFT_271930 [Xylaria longipes]|nr:hypothetical protein F4801DRAFT_271930 [Xylaria longipes]